MWFISHDPLHSTLLHDVLISCYIDFTFLALCILFNVPWKLNLLTSWLYGIKFSCVHKALNSFWYLDAIYGLCGIILTVTIWKNLEKPITLRNIFHHIIKLEGPRNEHRSRTADVANNHMNHGAESLEVTIHWLL
jgi:hypothetical protein